MTNRNRAVGCGLLGLFLALTLIAIARFPTLWAEWGPFMLVPFAVASTLLIRWFDKLTDEPPQ